MPTNPRSRCKRSVSVLFDAGHVSGKATDTSFQRQFRHKENHKLWQNLTRMVGLDGISKR